MAGEITVFLSLILTCICALMGGLLESARAAGSGWYLQMAVDSSLDSLMSQYHREVWENYRLLLLEFEDTKQLETEMEPYMNAYLDSDASFQLETEELSVQPPIRITEGSGRYLEQEILDYMRLGILTMEQKPEKLSELLEGVKEAASLGEITKHYQLDTRKAIKLEEALERIGTSLKKQREYLKSGKEDLEDCDGHGFLSQAKRLRRELQRMPSLIKQYEAAAADLEQELAASREEAEAKRGELKEDTWRMLSEEMEKYRAYTDQEGERRMQVLRTGQQAEENLKVVEAAIEEAEDTLDYIADWEPDDEDDELDEEPLWAEVLRTVSRFRTDESFAEPGVRDKKKMNLLQSISRLADRGLLTLVMPEGKEISKRTVNWYGFPSKTAETDGGSGGTGSSNAGDIGAAGEHLLEGILNTALIDEYMAHFFTNVLSEEIKPLSYEQEYLIAGKESDRENLQGVVERLLLVREAMNLMHLLTDTDKRREAEQLAVAILGAASISPLTAVTTFFILTVWAFAEAVEDLRALLRGDSVPFIKSRESWKLSLDNLMNAKSPETWTLEGGKDGNSGSKGGIGGNSGKAGDGRDSGTGMGYQDYLKLLFLMQDRKEKDYRMMDLIQLNVSERQHNFQMSHCAYRIEADCRARGRRIILTRRAVKAY